MVEDDEFGGLAWYTYVHLACMHACCHASISHGSSTLHVYISKSADTQQRSVIAASTVLINDQSRTYLICCPIPLIKSLSAHGSSAELSKLHNRDMPAEPTMVSWQPDPLVAQPFCGAVHCQITVLCCTRCHCCYCTRTIGTMTKASLDHLSWRDMNCCLFAGADSPPAIPAVSFVGGPHLWGRIWQNKALGMLRTQPACEAAEQHALDMTVKHGDGGCRSESGTSSEAPADSSTLLPVQTNMLYLYRRCINLSQSPAVTRVATGAQEWGESPIPVRADTKERPCNNNRQPLQACLAAAQHLNRTVEIGRWRRHSAQLDMRVRTDETAVQQRQLPAGACSFALSVQGALSVGHHLLQLELGLYEGPHVVCPGAALQEGQQAQQFLILVVVVPALDGDAVAQLEPEGLRGRVREALH